LILLNETVDVLESNNKLGVSKHFDHDTNLSIIAKKLQKNDKLTLKKVYYLRNDWDLDVAHYYDEIVRYWAINGITPNVPSFEEWLRRKENES